MSANLMYAPSKRDSKSLPDELKFILRDKRHLFEHGGVRTFGPTDREYLAGLVDAGVDGAQELIDAIEQYEEVDLWLEY